MSVLGYNMKCIVSNKWKNKILDTINKYAKCDIIILGMQYVFSNIAIHNQIFILSSVDF